MRRIRVKDLWPSRRSFYNFTESFKMIRGKTLHSLIKK